MKVGMRRVHVLSAIMAVMALLVGMVLAGNAHASTDADEYIHIGNVKVARSLGVTTEAQLQQRYSEGYLSVDFNEKAEITAIRPLNAEEMKEMQLTENQPGVVNETRVPCHASDVCLTFQNGSKRGFYGTGIRAGNWRNVASSNSGKWYAKYRIVYKGGSYDTPVVPPHTRGDHKGNTISKVTIIQ
ncbi:hypothetical protein EMB92_09240 [Bifidobacterium callitrichos]|uniref:Uncharacterized protein n=1 Tax=Bifidobacterium callitrichos TaxID=762209 RepID=A0A5M9ZA19_9BIFI|nr:hypothetical protein [Bifidobacterium callitrichos]KAA8815368.1 hypothetical protein EMB92_09240 [Bifidobacterium callitrichos]